MFFSVVIPLYNKSYSVKRCIESVLNQSYQSFEIIIVNDGSTDDSLNIVERNYKEEISRNIIKIINQPNQGVSVARNVGIQASRSELVCLLDADDEWLPNFLEKMSNLIKDYPLADLYCLAHLLRKSNDDLVKPKHGLQSEYRGYVENFFQTSSKGEVANSSKVCIRKSAVLALGGFPKGVVAGEDLYVWIRLALDGKVACDMVYAAIVNLEIDESRGARKNSVPYPLVYFSSKNNKLNNKELSKYLFVIFYKHFLASLLNFRFKETGLRLYWFLRYIFR